MAASGGAAHVRTVGGRRGQCHQVERDLAQRGLTGQRVQQAKGVLDGDQLLHLLLRPWQRDLRREAGAREHPGERPGVSSKRTAKVCVGGGAHLHNDQFGSNVVVGAQLLAETQRDAALRPLAAVAIKVLQLWLARVKNKQFYFLIL